MIRKLFFLSSTLVLYGLLGTYLWNIEDLPKVKSEVYMEEFPNTPDSPGYESPIRYSELEYDWPPCQEATPERIQALRDANLWKE